MTSESGKWINFNLMRRSPSGKTKVWIVATKEGERLGEIRWYGGWRSYVFHPSEATIFEKDCLRNIADFIQAKTAEHKSGSPT